MVSTLRFDKWENDTGTQSVSIDQISGGSGLVTVVPASISVASGTATTGSLGEVFFTEVTSLSINGIFTSTYKNYKILTTMHGTTTGTVLRMRYRASGSDRSSSLYFQSGFFSRSTNVTGTLGFASGTSLDIGRVISNTDIRSGLSLDVFNPQLALATLSTGLFTGQDSGSPIGAFANAGFLSADINDGFTIFPDSGTITGTLQVYGYR
jgi:hypothetical protein